MSLEVIAPRIRGFICTNAHPGGCAASVRRQIDLARAARPARTRSGNALVVGASTGYGLATRIAAAFTHDMSTLGVFLERPPGDRKTGTAGWYNTAAFQAAATAAGLRSESLNGDAFSDATRAQAVEVLRNRLGPVDLFVYSLAAPVRQHPETGQVLRSVLKPVGSPYTTKTVDLDQGRVSEITLEPACEEEIAATMAVMGGDDLRRWFDALLEADLLAPGVQVLAYSYVGPKVTWPIYRDGTIGRAKEDVLETTRDLDRRLGAHFSPAGAEAPGGGAWVSVNSAVVTQASAAIPAVPLYLSLLNRVLSERGLKEEAITEMARLLNEHLASGRKPALDEEGRIRVDDIEMRADVQAEVARRWERVDTGNVLALSDLEGVRREFRQLFGFAIEGVDYEAPVETHAELPSR